MAGYSGKPLAEKLGIRVNYRITIANPPDGLRDELGPLPTGVKVVGIQKPLPETLDVILFFPRSSDELAAKFGKLADKLSPAGGLWIGWPKKASGVETDLSFDVVQKTGLYAGLVDNKVCAINDVYTGLRFVIRLENRK